MAIHVEAEIYLDILSEHDIRVTNCVIKLSLRGRTRELERRHYYTLLHRAHLHDTPQNF